MEKICLVEAGNYLLGIDTAIIVQKMDKDSFMAGEQKEDSSLVVIASFFDQIIAELPQLEFSLLELETASETMTLLVDRIVGEVNPKANFESLPLLYPQLARTCCPQITVHNNQPVLLLDGAGLATVVGQLGSDRGVISIDVLRAGYQQDSIAEDSELCDSSAEETTEKTGAETYDLMFNRIVSWTIGQYLDREYDVQGINIDELPPEYAHSAQVQGVSNNLLQIFIDKTIRKCRRSSAEDLEKLRKKMAENP